MGQTANQKFVAQVMAEIITNHRDDATQKRKNREAGSFFDKILKSLLDDTGLDKLTNAMVRASIILDGVHPKKTLKSPQMLKAQKILAKALKSLIANDDWITIIAAAKKAKKMM